MDKQTRSGDWYDETKKLKAVYKVLHYLAEHQQEASDCVGNDAKARQLFKDHGGIVVPELKDDPSARVVILAPGEKADVGTSVVLEIPPPELKDASDNQLFYFVVGAYPYWPGQ